MVPSRSTPTRSGFIPGLAWAQAGSARRRPRQLDRGCAGGSRRGACPARRPYQGIATPPLGRDRAGKPTAESQQRLIAAAEKGPGPWYAVHHGFEVQICDVADPWHRTGSIYSLAQAAAAPRREPGSWRTMIVTLRGDQIQVAIDGQRVSTFNSADRDLPPRRAWHEPQREPKRPHVGYLGLQNHDPGDVVYFRTLDDYRRRILARLDRERRAWPF